MSILEELLIDSDYAIQVGGRTYNVRPITLKQAASLSAWVGKTFPSPLKSIGSDLLEIKDGLDREKFLDIAASLYETWPPEYGSSETTSRLMFSTLGKREVIREALRFNHPEISGSDDACWALARSITAEEFGKLVTAFHGRDPNIPKVGAANNGGLMPDLLGKLLLSGLLDRGISPKKSEI